MEYNRQQEEAQVDGGQQQQQHYVYNKQLSNKQLSPHQLREDDEEEEKNVATVPEHSRTIHASVPVAVAINELRPTVPTEYKDEVDGDDELPSAPIASVGNNQHKSFSFYFRFIARFPSLCIIMSLLPAVITTLLLIFPRWTIQLDLSYGQFVLDGDIDAEHQNALEAAVQLNFKKAPPAITSMDDKQPMTMMNYHGKSMRTTMTMIK